MQHKTSMNWRAAVVAGLVALTLALFLYSPRARDEPTHDDPPDDTLQPAPRAPEPALEAKPETAPGPGQVSALAAPPAMPASGHFDAMQRAFASESRDGRWARSEEARIPQLVAEAGFPDDAFDRNVTCRRTLCRLQLRVAESDMFALMKLAAKVQTSKGLGLAYGAAEAMGDKTRVDVYIPREGTAPEDLEKP